MDTGVRPNRRTITVETFLADPHAAKYRDVVDRDAEALDRVFTVLNDHQVVHDMTSATRLDLPALQGAVGPIEADPVIADVLDGPRGQRFRQAVGVAVRLKMESLGFATTGRKGSVRAQRFSRAERYQPQTPEAWSARRRARALAGLERVAAMGDPEEQRESSAILMEALAATRRAEGRPF